MRQPSTSQRTTQALALALLTIFSLSFMATAHAEIVGDATRGKAVFDSTCQHCHFTNYDDSAVGAPGLQGVLDRHDVAWLNHWIKGPEAFAKTNEIARILIESNKFGLIMPTLPEGQDDQKRADVIEYLKTLK